MRSIHKHNFSMNVTTRYDERDVPVVKTASDIFRRSDERLLPRPFKLFTRMHPSLLFRVPSYHGTAKFKNTPKLTSCFTSSSHSRFEFSCRALHSIRHHSSIIQSYFIYFTITFYTSWKCNPTKSYTFKTLVIFLKSRRHFQSSNPHFPPNTGNTDAAKRSGSRREYCCRRRGKCRSRDNNKQ